MAVYTAANGVSKQIFEWTGFFLGPALCIGCLLGLPRTYLHVASETNRQSLPAVGQQRSAEHGTGISPHGDVAHEGPALERRDFSWEGRATLAVMVWMAVWWLSEAVPITVTALLPLAVFPLLGATTMEDAAAPYAHHLIFLYFGGFILAFAMEKCGLGTRIALNCLLITGTTASRMVAGFMLSTALLSAFVSNTATTAMMLPIAMSTIGLLRQGRTSDASTAVDRFGACLLLAIAYSASIGGVATIIGTPPNAFLVGFLADSISPMYRMEISFVGWLPIGLSMVALFLPLVYWLLTRCLFPITDLVLDGGQELVHRQLQRLGRVSRAERMTAVVFLSTVACWLFRPLLTSLVLPWGDGELRPLGGLTDTGIVMVATIMLFILPLDWKRRQFLMDWQTASKTPWDILLLFGGGLSLAYAIRANGVAEYLASYTTMVGDTSDLLVIVAVSAAIVFLTELTSNVATTTSLVPVLAALAPGLGIHPVRLVVPAAIAASCAFMLPVATPPNAIVFGSGYIRLPQMVRAGIGLNLLSIVLIPLVTETVAWWCLSGQ
ncbi:MAG: di- and tricarboxylate transporter [Pirellulaceae bacterium]|nr:MAG: di- and tricarboxylate transporter [Pirellulaceae bacterium]